MDTDNAIKPPGFLSRALALLLNILILPLAILPLSLHLFLGKLGGRLYFRLVRRRRTIAVENIKRIQESGFLPESADPAKTARDSFVSTSQTIMEGLAFHIRGLGYYQGRVSLSHEEFFHEALKDTGPGKRGLVMLTAHLGNWEMAPQVLRERFGLKINIIGRSQGSAALDWLIYKSRTRTGNGFIFKDGSARLMLRILKDGGAIGTLFDQAAIVEREGALLNFMGRPARTNLGPVKLAALTGARLLPLFSIREGRSHVIEFCSPITPPPRAGSEWILQSAQLLNDALGEVILRHPSQWMWGHRRWKTPEGIRGDPLSF